MMGGYFHGHPWSEKVGVRLDEPGHPLCAAFKGEGFSVTDRDSTSSATLIRGKVCAFCSALTLPGTDMTKKGIQRTDGDFAVSWIRNYGKGRVFYCSLGHEHEIFADPADHWPITLDGIQFALGDLERASRSQAVTGPCVLPGLEGQSKLSAVGNGLEFCLPQGVWSCF